MMTKTFAFIVVWANGNQLQFKAATTSSEEFRFSVYCMFTCLLCTYIMFLHLILHLIVKRLTVFNVSMKLNAAFCATVICYYLPKRNQVLCKSSLVKNLI